jgi:hypothetical protein
MDVTSLAGNVSVVMSGLDSPRGLDFGPQGALYVAEAGRGGGGGAPSIVQRGSTFYYGATGAISRLWHGQQERVATGLPSLALANGNRGTGPSDISMLGVGNAYVTIGLEGDPALRDQLGDVGAGFAHLIRLTPDGRSKPVADIGGAGLPIARFCGRGRSKRPPRPPRLRTRSGRVDLTACATALPVPHGLRDMGYHSSVMQTVSNRSR